jgi:hypothetical protein
MHNRREIIILSILFLGLVAFVILGPAQTPQDTITTSPTTHSSAAGGALALLRWTRELGYDARRLEFQAFTIDERADALFVLNPAEPFQLAQAREVLDWVEAGGTLILADDRPRLFAQPNELLAELDVTLAAYQEGGSIERATALQPALHTPPLREIAPQTRRVLDTERTDAAPLFGARDSVSGEQEGIVLLGLRHGEGYIYLSSATYPFTNEGLRNEQHAALVLNLLRRVPPGGRVLFDEYHHGFFEPPSLLGTIASNAWGWGLLYALGVSGVYLLLTGRRFGRPVPLPEETRRRSSAEYVESMADLLQRGGKRGFVLRHYRDSLKRRLARPYGISPHLDDDAFVRELARYRPLADEDQERLRTLLARMRREQVGEEELLRLIAEADAARSRRETLRKGEA